MQIKTLVVTPFQQNCRILFDNQSGSAAVIDPGGDIDQIIAALDELEARTESIVLTHAHIDHAGGVASLESALKSRGLSPKLYAHKLEREMRASIGAQAQMFGLPPSQYQNAREPDVYFDDGDKFELGSVQAKVLFTPGHAPGHVSLYFPDIEGSAVLIAGDTLFAGSIGRTDLPGGDFDTLAKSIRDKLYTLPEDTRVLSGHGPDTTIGEEKHHNPFVRE